ALSEAMPDRNMYAIQPRGLEERALPDHSVVAAARRNVLAIRAVQPSGPYSLLGYSYGGIVAFEMACRLRSLSEEGTLLAILDTGAPVEAPSLMSSGRARANALSTDSPASRFRRVSVIGARWARFATRSIYAHAERRITLASAGLVPRRGYTQ